MVAELMRATAAETAATGFVRVGAGLGQIFGRKAA